MNRRHKLPTYLRPRSPHGAAVDWNQRVLRCWQNESQVCNEEMEEGREFQIIGTAVCNKQEPKDKLMPGTGATLINKLSSEEQQAVHTLVGSSRHFHCEEQLRWDLLCICQMTTRPLLLSYHRSVHAAVLFLRCPRSEGWPDHGRTFSIYLYPLSFWLTLPQRVLSKDVNESRNARVSKKILVLENLISRRGRNSRTYKVKLCCPN